MANDDCTFKVKSQTFVYECNLTQIGSKPDCCQVRCATKRAGHTQGILSSCGTVGL
jgi:hypothetical protein